jgi:hypothetical protein
MIVGVCLVAVSTSAASNLTEMDEAHLIFMRSEEKLARDVYLTIAEIYPVMPIFRDIATRSEQTHTDTMRKMLVKFHISDPEPSTAPGVLPPDDQLGVFENPYFADYFTEKYDLLVGLAGIGLEEALYVGATIEELDMLDINFCNSEAFDQYYPGLPASPDCGGLALTTVKALQNALGSLMAGSENHLCAFVSQLGPMIDGCYESQVLSQQQVRDIIEADCSEFIGFICEPETP